MSLTLAMSLRAFDLASLSVSQLRDVREIEDAWGLGGSRVRLRIVSRLTSRGCIPTTFYQALKRRGLKTGGRKEELLARLREDIQRAQREERGLMMQVCEGPGRMCLAARFMSL